MPPRRLHSPADYLALARAPETGADLLRHLAGSPYSFVWQAVAVHPNTPPDVLLRLCSQRDSAWNDNRLLALIAGHPRAGRDVLLAVLGEVTARLGTPGNRPYAAGLRLAERTELEPDEILPLAALPGASRRFRKGLRARLARRAVEL
ncbi:hypothetical protein GCM10023085_74350 [Actinomadura viridis]|uniref:Uncharacterized protein n=1 Tax=Actinomadura viridis TaxID=58110 RepID=A0A931DIG4_9ACTN|nr:hypothetical protein [Actinomadura viridis]MBG6087555.1 hypothetical protein [Actinomadura viridis]